MLQQELNDERLLIDEMMKRALDAMMMSEGGDDQACQRREPADSGEVERERAAHETPWTIQIKGKGNLLPYLLSSVGPGADPGGGLAQLVATLVRSTKLLYAGPGKYWDG